MTDADASYIRCVLMPKYANLVEMPIYVFKTRFYFVYGG